MPCTPSSKIWLRNFDGTHGAGKSQVRWEAGEIADVMMTSVNIVFSPGKRHRLVIRCRKRVERGAAGYRGVWKHSLIHFEHNVRFRFFLGRDLIELSPFDFLEIRGLLTVSAMMS